MAYEHVALETKGQVCVLTLDRPPVNSLNSKLLLECQQVLDQLKEDQSCKVVLIVGKGSFFVAGADIKQFTTLENEAQAKQLAQAGQKLCSAIEAFPKPVIAAIHGAALGGGLELALACHLRFATPEAKLGLPELSLGLIPGFGGTQRLPQLIGRAKALELMFTSKPLSGEEARQVGLVNGCFSEDELLDQTLAIAQTITSKSNRSLKYVLEAVKYGQESGNLPGEDPIFSAGEEKEAMLFGKIFATEDAQEGIHAFLEKRKPNFKDE